MSYHEKKYNTQNYYHHLGCQGAHGDVRWAGSGPWSQILSMCALKWDLDIDKCMPQANCNYKCF